MHASCEVQKDVASVARIGPSCTDGPGVNPFEFDVSSAHKERLRNAFRRFRLRYRRRYDGYDPLLDEFFSKGRVLCVEYLCRLMLTSPDELRSYRVNMFCIVEKIR